MFRWFVLALIITSTSQAGVGDPQIATDHLWYPGELSYSTFERLFATQAAVYKRVTGRECVTDEDKAIAAWLWRNTHYFHAEEGVENLWGKGFKNDADSRSREYWTGLFSHGYGLCGTTHAQFVAEMEALLGHGRGRDLGCSGHNSFEVFLKGGAYGDGKWALLDSDQSCVVFDVDGKRLLGLKEIAPDWKKLTDRAFKPNRQHGWLICGLHPSDNQTYSEYRTAEYLAGYAGPPPSVHLRRGETFRRYLSPGLEDGKTFVFWGMNYNTEGIPGPERANTWVNQPEAMFKSKNGSGSKPGQARFANAVFTYRPDFDSGDYREGVISEDDTQVTFEFRSPYVIAATPANAKPWGIYDPGAKNGLIVRGESDCKVSVSVDRGTTWHDGGQLNESPDLTDHVKGHRQYWLRLHNGAKKLAASKLTITTVCEASAATMPRLKDGGSIVRFEATGKGLVSAGPTLPQATTHVVDGRFGSPAVTLGLATPRKETITGIYAAGHVRSSNPPDAKIKYQIEASFDDGISWKPIVKDWTINRQGDEPADFWSQSMCWGELTGVKAGTAVKVRFKNNGGKQYARAELHLTYKLPQQDATRVTFAYTDATGDHTADHTFTSAPGEGNWTVPTGQNTRTKWVEFGVAVK
ncbi:hypothetical protein [Zavarzinella formosa]|uniref:hypothetical protein n=1 Tax=Zavarzinella formosa TaxID=360055 RepID=UPI0003137C44|nr:hypothetical protein [Zavarzinella formosa]